jgi:multiple sugar transport system ATP-binding protein
MRAEIAKIQHDLNVTTVYVTHDQIEAMTMGDRVAVMSKGTLMQVDSPQNLYDHPNNLFVAAFIGSPQMNLLRGKYQSGTGGGTIRLGSAIIALSEAPAALADYSGPRHRRRVCGRSTSSRHPLPIPPTRSAARSRFVRVSAPR